MQKIPDTVVHHLMNYQIGPLRNLLLGAGVCFSIEKEKYWHIPLIILCPSPYVGYHLYKNKKEVIRFFKDL